METSPLLEVIEEKGGMRLKAMGAWRAQNLAGVDLALRALEIPKKHPVEIDLGSLTYIDTAGAWVLSLFLKRLVREKVPHNLKGASPETLALLEQVKTYEIPEVAPEEKKFPYFVRQLNTLGFKTYETGSIAKEMLSFLGEVSIVLFNTLLNPRRLRFISFCSLIQKVGANALPIVGLMSFLIGIVLVYQGADQLKRFGAEIFTVDLLAVSVLREIGILLTAILIAGRSGSAFTAEIGFMKLNQEVDAMMVLGLNPVEVLVIPRILALVVALPLLGFYADIMALVGGAFMSFAIIDLSMDDFLRQLRLAVLPRTFWVGIVKAPVFAFIIAFIGCFEGLRVSGGAESVGQQTTRSVVEGIFLVIVLDAIFSIIFAILGV